MNKSLLLQIKRNSLFIYFNALLRSLLLILKNPTIFIDRNTSISKTVFGKYNRIGSSTSLYKVQLGDYSYIGRNCFISRSSIGKFCSIGENIRIGLGKHPTERFVSTHPAFYSNKEKHYFLRKQIFKEYEDVKIGNDVWIGTNVVILDGINIGNGAIIAAGSVVTKDVEPYSIVGGVPAKHIKFRFADNEIIALEKSQWWNWQKSELLNNVEKFSDINIFINYLISNR